MAGMKFVRIDGSEVIYEVAEVLYGTGVCCGIELYLVRFGSLGDLLASLPKWG